MTSAPNARAARDRHPPPDGGGGGDSGAPADKPATEARIQHDFYAARARAHVIEPWGAAEHDFALSMLLGYLDLTRPESALDVGAGCGRALKLMRERRPGLRVQGVEPSAAFREIGHARLGLSSGELLDGDATRLPFDDDSFDVVTEFGVLHHIRNPSQAVAEMCRVARRAVFISDCNNYGQGGRAARLAKRALRAAGLWKAVDRMRTGGKGYTITEGDGLAYSYSVFDDLPIVRRAFDRVVVMNTSGQSIAHAREAAAVVVIADDRPW
ncbi:MAG: class I SAM-dependent methyltransferase [Rhodospirillales bacterium]|nr:MAG: class I SAM-dependent methyltransferase [Rhodospirillales bacterium]